MHAETVLVPGQFGVVPPVVMSVEEEIQLVAQENGADPDLAVRIARAESDFDPLAKNPHSTASGVFQFLDSTFHTYCIQKYKLTDTIEEKNDRHIQIECATRMLAAGGASHWNESKYLWMTNSN